MEEKGRKKCMNQIEYIKELHDMRWIMMNKIIFENGIEHEFTADELKMLKVCIAVLANDKILLNNSLSRIDANRFKWDKYYLALKQLYSLFLHQLD